MKYNALHDAGRFSKLRRNRKRWQKVVSVMASIVVFCTTYALILPAITAESQDLSNVQLICNQAEHSHGAECSVIERGELICQTPTEPAHTHGDACYAVEVVTETSTVEVLTCTSEEEGHQHDSSCYTAEERTTEKEVSKLICTEDTSAHEHGDSCYAQIVKQICTLEEHIHGAGCYEAKDEIKLPEQPQQPVESEQPVEPEAPVEPEQPVEGQEPEVPVEPEHVHDETCIQAEDGTWSCETPVVEPEQPVEPEVPAHQHEDACYDENGQLICEIAAEEEVQPEIPVLPEVEEPEIDEDVICEMYEHEHYELCYDANGEVICPLYEHEHDETCYPEEELFVALPEGAQVPETHSETYMKAAEADEEGNIPYSVAVYTEPGTLPEGARLAVELLEDEAYTAAGEQLAEQGITPSGYIAFDIHFEAPSHVHSQDLCYDEEGNLDCAEEIVWEEYPIDSTVYVSINARNMLPEGIDEQSVQVHHHAETDMNILDKAVALFTGEPVVVIETVVDQLLNMEAEIAPEMNLIETFVSELDETMLDINAAFEVNGFSTFTVTWGSNNRDMLKVNTVITYTHDEDGVKYTDFDSAILKGNDFNAVEALSIEQLMSKAGLANQVKNANATYNYTSARANANTGVEVVEVRYADNQWIYKDKDGNEGELTQLQLIYKVDGQTFQGVTPTGVTVNVFDYDESKGIDSGHFLDFKNPGGSGGNINDPNNWTGNGGGVVPEIVAPNLDDDGFPTIGTRHTTNNRSLQYLFNPSTTGNGVNRINKDADYLFLDMGNGRYAYDSSKNAAKLDTNGDFVLYNKAADNSSDANFMPYDDYNKNTNYHFGVHINSPFLMPEDGIIDGEHMIFDFDGDDDVWIFIDGMLVLDMGGIHVAYDGQINFATGEVYIEAVNTGAGSGFWGSPTSAPLNTTLEAMIRTALADQGMSANEINAWINDNMTNSKVEDYENNLIFKDYSKHTLDMFYLERGAGGSNCKIDFNLQTVPQNSLIVEKEVIGADEAVINLLGDLEYEFQVRTADFGKDAAGQPVTKMKVYDEENKELAEYTSDSVLIVERTPFEVQDSKGNFVRNDVVGANGIFKLKHGERAVFSKETSGIDFPILRDDANVPYTVRELLDESYKIQYNGVLFEISGEGGQAAQFGDIEGMEDFVGLDSPAKTGSNGSGYVKFHNVVNTEMLNFLYVQKDGGKAGETYKMRVLVNGEKLSKETAYYVYDKVTNEQVGGKREIDANGIIELSSEQYAALDVANLIAGSEITVTEVNLNEFKDYTAEYSFTSGYLNKETNKVVWDEVDPFSKTPVTETVEFKVLTSEVDGKEEKTEVGSYNKLIVKNILPGADFSLTKTLKVCGAEPTDTLESDRLDDEFTFELTMAKAAGMEYEVVYTNAHEYGKVHTDGKITFNADGVAVIKLFHGEKALIKTLPIEVMEIEEQGTDGYSVSWVTKTGTIEAPGSGAVQNVTVGTHTDATCINTTGYALPSTGGIGTTLYTMSGMAMMSAALVGGYGLRRKRERGSEE